MDSAKLNVNVSFVGHVDIGKSTLMGRLMVDLKQVTKRELEKSTELARRLHDETRKYALIMHRIKEEEKATPGKTILPSRTRIELPDKFVSLIDVPGHPNYFKNMISGIFQSDCAILVVDAKDPIETQPQLIDALNILKGFGIPLVGVAINKIDEKKYSLDAFEGIRRQILTIVSRIGIQFDTQKIFPSSGLEGEGVTSYSRMKYDGSTLLDVISGIQLPVLNRHRPTRFLFRNDDVLRPHGIGMVLVGVVESGIIQKGDDFVFEPMSTILGRQITATIRSMQLAKGTAGAPGIPIDLANPRQIVGLAVRATEKDLYRMFKRKEFCHGSVAGIVADDPPKVATEFLAEVTLVWAPSIPRGFQALLDYNVDEAGMVLTDILEKGKPSSYWIEGTKLRERTHLVKIRTFRPIAIDDEIPWLGRFILRDQLRVIGFGRCLETTEIS